MKITGVSRTLLILFLHVMVIFIHSLLLASGETREACINGTPLFDVIHNYATEGIWPFNKFYLIRLNYIVHPLTVILILIMIRHSQRQILIRRFLIFHSAMSVIRGIFIWVTTIPSPTDLCFERTMESADVVSRSVALTFSAIGIPYDWYQIGIPGMTCCDSIISGHTAMLMVLALLITSTVKNTWFRLFIWAAAIAGMAGLITTTWHYTIDILAAAIIALLLFKVYTLTVQFKPNFITRFIEGDINEPATKGVEPKTLKQLIFGGQN